MSLFPDPQTHAANPPDSWRAVKLADRNWALTTRSGDRLQTGLRTRREIAPPGDSDFPSGLRVQRFTFHDQDGRPFLTISAFSPESETAPTIEQVSP